MRSGFSIKTLIAIENAIRDVSTSLFRSGVCEEGIFEKMS